MLFIFAGDVRHLPTVVHVCAKTCSKYKGRYETIYECPLPTRSTPRKYNYSYLLLLFFFSFLLFSFSSFIFSSFSFFSYSFSSFSYSFFLFLLILPFIFLFFFFLFSSFSFSSSSPRLLLLLSFCSQTALVAISTSVPLGFRLPLLGWFAT